MICPTDPAKTRQSMALLRRVARVRGADFLPALLAIGQLTEDGEWLDLPRDAWKEQLAAHAPPGLGDAVALALRPLARAADRVTAGTPMATNLEHCQKCHGRDGNGGRQSALNRVAHL